MDTEVRKSYVIRLMEDRDLDAARILHNDWSVIRWLTHARHVSPAQQGAWYASVCSSPQSARYVVVEARNGSEAAVAGVFRADHLDPVNGSVMVGLDVAAPYRGRKLSYLVYEYFLEYFFHHLRMHRVYLKVLETNAVAIHTYERLGFCREGVEKEAVFRCGRYVDYVCMSILSHQYEQDSDRHRALRQLGEVSGVLVVDPRANRVG